MYAVSESSSGHARGEVRVAHLPAAQDLTVGAFNRVGEIMPGIVADISPLAQVPVIRQVGIGADIRMQAIITFVGLEAALADKHAQGRIGRNIEPC